MSGHNNEQNEAVCVWSLINENGKSGKIGKNFKFPQQCSLSALLPVAKLRDAFRELLM